MSGHATSTDVAIRSYRDADEPEVLELVRGSLGEGPAGSRPPEYFRWKHLENPFGRSFMLVAECDERIVGFRALMRWRFAAGDRAIEAVRPVDTVTHPDYRGRGVFSALTRMALDSLHGEVDLVFNTPNPNSLPGYVKMGWQVVGDVPVRVRIRRPARFLAGRLRRGREAAETAPERPSVAAPKAAEVLADGGPVDELIARAERPTTRYVTPRSLGFLRWRYGSAPVLDYHAVTVERGGALAGACFFRLRRQDSVWGASVADLIVADGDGRTASELLRAARQAADVAYVAGTFAPGTTADAAFRRWTFRAPHGITLVANPRRPDLTLDPLTLSSWALATGDVEVF